MEKSNSSVRKPIINPMSIDESLLNDMNIDLGMRCLVSKLLRHGYDTAFSCEGHGTDQSYISFRRGSGDGSFEKEASGYSLKVRKEKACCNLNNEPFCPECGSSKVYVTYCRSRDNPFSLDFSSAL